MARTESSAADWKHLVIYGTVLAIVAVVGGVAIWSFILRQALVIQPETLPKVTVVTRDPSSPLAASWVRLLTDAEMSPTLVPLETFDPIEGVVVFCDIPEIPPRLADLLDEFVRRGGALAFVGVPTQTAIGKFRLHAEPGMSDTSFRLGENASPVLARLVPGTAVETERTEVALLKESPRMRVDARWAESQRAAIMHMEIDGGRYIWMGFDPRKLGTDKGQLMLLLRTAFRWVSGQPVSDGAVGAPQAATTLDPDSRREARENRFMFSVDPTRKDNVLTVRMMNRGGVPMQNPTVKIWLPPRVTEVALGGNFVMNRKAVLTGAPEEGACVLTLPSLTRNEERMLSLRIVSIRPPVSREQQHASR